MWESGLPWRLPHTTGLCLVEPFALCFRVTTVGSLVISVSLVMTRIATLVLSLALLCRNAIV